jgi:hypothetical protein
MKKLHVVQKILAKDSSRAVTQLMDNDGLSPLHSLCGSNCDDHESDVQMLKVSFRFAVYSSVPFFLLSKFCLFPLPFVIRQALISAGCSLCVGDAVGATPLHYAVSKKENAALVNEIIANVCIG